MYGSSLNATCLARYLYSQASSALLAISTAKRAVHCSLSLKPSEHNILADNNENDRLITSSSE